MASNGLRHLRKGNYYHIVNLKTKLALAMPETKKYTKDKPEFRPVDPLDNSQLWMLEEVQN